MKRWKVILYSILICLPAVLALAGWLYLVLAWMPTQVRSQQQRLGRHFTKEAERVIADPSGTVRLTSRPKGWRKSNDFEGKPWGRFHDGERNFIWFQSATNEWRVAQVEAQDEFPYEIAGYFGGGGVLLVLLVLTVLAVWNLVRFMKERDDFLAATAHDLTTPLVGMRMMIGRNDEEAKALNERMIRLVDNIKDFLRLGGRRPAPKRETFDLVKAYETAYALFAEDYRDLFDGEDIQTSQTSQTSVQADETMTVQILWNLLGNDLKYAAPYGKVSVRFAREGEFVKVEFIDEGQGMTPRQMRKAFDRYYRAKTVLKSGKGGFGIGLCTAKEFARAMGGDLTVRANMPRGCIFTLYLPAAI